MSMFGWPQMVPNCDMKYTPLCDYYRRHGDSKCHYKDTHNVECPITKGMEDRT